ncbi:MAG: peroxiredoxin [Acidimicrobiia bacterium]
MTVEIGQEAPDFSLKGQDGESVQLSKFRGDKTVALVFYPFTFSGLCESELCQLRDDFSQFEDAGMQVLAVSCDSRFAQKQWAEQKGYQFPVLSDFWPHGAVAKAYGVFNDEIGCAIRATFIIGKDGVVADQFSTDSLGTAREKSSYDAALAKV